MAGSVLHTFGNERLMSIFMIVVIWSIWVKFQKMNLLNFVVLIEESESPPSSHFKLTANLKFVFLVFFKYILICFNKQKLCWLA